MYDEHWGVEELDTIKPHFSNYHVFLDEGLAVEGLQQIVET